MAFRPHALLLCLLVVQLAHPIPMAAQVDRAELTGTASDQQDQRVPQCTVRATETTTGFVRETFTTTQGNYELSLPPGLYVVRFLKSGFANFTVDHVRQIVGRKRTLNVRLELPRGQEQATVTEALVQLDKVPPPSTPSKPRWEQSRPYSLRGHLLVSDTPLRALTEAEMRRVRGGSIAMIFQDPMSSLNPYLPVGEQIAEVARLHLGLSRHQAKTRAVEMLERVGIPDAASRAESYPHQLSGGMRQRVMIATALTGKPKVVIADEPTTALDVTIQAQILALLRALVREERASMILITHDLGVIGGTGDKMTVMYAGCVMESGSVAQVFGAPRNPYTRALLRSIPDPSRKGIRLFQLPDSPAKSATSDRRGCPFAARCPEAFSQCHDTTPPVRAIQLGHTSRCWIES